jgi:hypothetical protein
VTTKVVIDEYYLFQYSLLLNAPSAPSDADGATARGGAFVAFVFSSRKNVFSRRKNETRQKKRFLFVQYALCHLATSITDPLGATLYLAPQPGSPSGVKSAGDGRFVSTTLCHDFPPGGGGSAAST